MNTLIVGGSKKYGASLREALGEQPHTMQRTAPPAPTGKAVVGKFFRVDLLDESDILSAISNMHVEEVKFSKVVFSVSPFSDAPLVSSHPVHNLLQVSTLGPLMLLRHMRDFRIFEKPAQVVFIQTHYRKHDALPTVYTQACFDALFTHIYRDFEPDKIYVNRVQAPAFDRPGSQHIRGVIDAVRAFLTDGRTSRGQTAIVD